MPRTAASARPSSSSSVTPGCRRPLRSRCRPCGPRLPPLHERCWPAVREFLRAVRGLDPDLLARCRRAGLLYADARRNAVFVCRDPAGAVTGAELVGTRPDPGGRTFKGLAPGSRKARGGFWLPPARAAPQAVLLVESALDALSVRQCPPPGLPAATLIASTAGVTATWPPWLEPWSALPPLCGYDADPAGDRAATALQRQCPRRAPPPPPRGQGLERTPPTFPHPLGACCKSVNCRVKAHSAHRYGPKMRNCALWRPDFCHFEGFRLPIRWISRASGLLQQAPSPPSTELRSSTPPPLSPAVAE